MIVGMDLAAHAHHDPAGAGERLPAVRGQEVVDQQDVTALPRHRGGLEPAREVFDIERRERALELAAHLRGDPRQIPLGIIKPASALAMGQGLVANAGPL